MLPHGFRARDLRAHLAPLLDLPADSTTAGQLTYDLRRLRLNGLIERIDGTHRYTVTDQGLRLAVYLTRVHRRPPYGPDPSIGGCRPAPFLGLSARGVRPGWTSWGTQAADDYAPTWATYGHNRAAEREKNPALFIAGE